MVTAELTATHPAERTLRPGEQQVVGAWRELVEANAEQVRRLRSLVAIGSRKPLVRKPT